MKKRGLNLVMGASLFFMHPPVRSQRSPESLLVREAQQAAHERELLGPRFPFSAHAPEKALHFIVDAFKQNLPDSWKSQASELGHTLMTEAGRYGLDPIFLLSVIQLESGFNPQTFGQHGERGLMQIRPSTAKWLGQEMHLQVGNLFNPVVNIRIGTAYWAWLREHFHRSSRLYIAAYNMGPEGAQRYLQNGRAVSSYETRLMRRYLKFYGVMDANTYTRL